MKTPVKKKSPVATPKINIGATGIQSVPEPTEAAAGKLPGRNKMTDVTLKRGYSRVALAAADKSNETGMKKLPGKKKPPTLQQADPKTAAAKKKSKNVSTNKQKKK
jgi:hypothetical protein